MNIDKIELGFLPTPIQPLKQLSMEFPDYSIFIKRDDNTGLAFGGNKTRKLEYLIKQGIDEGCDTIITAGAQQSNHCRQTAAACAMVGLECHLLLGGIEPDMYSGNLLLSKILGAKIHFTGENRKGENIGQHKELLESRKRKCFVIPYGGSNVIGALGFVNAVKELKAQLEEMQIEIDYIFFASSSGGMQSGIMLGSELYDLHAKLVPINIDKAENNGAPLEESILKILKDGTKLLDIEKEYYLKDIPLNKDYDSAGYGIMTENEQKAILELASKEGILLDPVYTGRAFYGMMDYLKKSKATINSNILFWHTGGTPAIFKFADGIIGK